MTFIIICLFFLQSHLIQTLCHVLGVEIISPASIFDTLRRPIFVKILRNEKLQNIKK